MIYGVYLQIHAAISRWCSFHGRRRVGEIYQHPHASKDWLLKYILSVYYIACFTLFGLLHFVK
jgi:hypothetical protein